MASSPTHLPPVVTPIAHKDTGLPTLEQLIWQQELLLSRSPWIPYTPVNANLTAITLNDCAFSTAGKRVTVRIAITGTSNGSFFNVQLPFKAKSQNQTFAVVNQALNFTGLALLGADLITLTVAKYDASAPGNGVVQGWIIEGSYEAA